MGAKGTEATGQQGLSADLLAQTPCFHYSEETQERGRHLSKATQSQKRQKQSQTHINYSRPGSHAISENEIDKLWEAS